MSSMVVNKSEMTDKHALYSLQQFKLGPSGLCTAKLSTELGAICARVLIVSNGCPTRTCAAPPTLPAMSSLIVACVVDFIFELQRSGEYGLGCSIINRASPVAQSHVDHMTSRRYSNLYIKAQSTSYLLPHRQ